MSKIATYLLQEYKTFTGNGGADMYHFMTVIKPKLNNFGIRFNYDATTLPNKNRMVLFTKRSSNRATIKYNPQTEDNITLDDVFECNGLILDYSRDFKIMCYPPPAAKNINTLPDVNCVLSNFDKYSASIAPIGTVISFYNYNGTWLISSLQSYDLTHYTMRGFEYNKIFDLIDTSGLDHKCSYTIGFRTPEMHYSSSTLIWFIAQTNLITFQTSYEKPDCLSNLMDTRELKLHSAGDLKEWIIYNGANVAPASSAGILLRSDYEGMHKCLFIETNFAKNFRKLIFDMYMYKQEHSQKNHRKYSLLRMWIMNIRPENIRQLNIPNMIPYYIQWDKYITANYQNLPEVFDIKNNRIAERIRSSPQSAKKLLKQKRHFDAWYYHIFINKQSPIYVSSINLMCQTF